MNGGYLWAVLFSIVDKALLSSGWCCRMPRLIFVFKSTNPLAAYFLKLIHLVTHKLFCTLSYVHRSA